MDELTLMLMFIICSLLMGRKLYRMWYNTELYRYRMHGAIPAMGRSHRNPGELILLVSSGNLVSYLNRLLDNVRISCSRSALYSFLSCAKLAHRLVTVIRLCAGQATFKLPPRYLVKVECMAHRAKGWSNADIDFFYSLFTEYYTLQNHTDTECMARCRQRVDHTDFLVI